jgi:hypothetical protein
VSAATADVLAVKQVILLQGRQVRASGAASGAGEPSAVCVTAVVDTAAGILAPLEGDAAVVQAHLDMGGSRGDSG